MGTRTCPKCNGRGYVTDIVWTVIGNAIRAAVWPKPKRITKTCPRCNGRKTVST